MGRIRTIKPEFWKHEVLSSLPEAVHILAAALLNYADDEGYFNANPGLIKGECFPLREPSVSIQEGLRELSNVGYLRLGKGPDGRRYGSVVSFRNHQNINRPTSSKIKNLGIVWDNSSTPHPPLTEDSSPEQGTGNREKEQGTGGKSVQGLKSATPPEPLHNGHASCKPHLVETQSSVDPERNPELRDLATLAALSAPFYRAKPDVSAAAVTVSQRREVYAAARWEITNYASLHPGETQPTLPQSLEILRRLVEQHERAAPREFENYRNKPLEFYFRDKAYHNTPSTVAKRETTNTGRMRQELDEIRRQRRGNA